MTDRPTSIVKEPVENQSVYETITITDGVWNPQTQEETAKTGLRGVYCLPSTPNADNTFTQISYQIHESGIVTKRVHQFKEKNGSFLTTGDKKEIVFGKFNPETNSFSEFSIKPFNLQTA